MVSPNADYDALAGRLRGLVIALMDVFSPDELREVEEFIEHAEFGEALHSLAWIVTEEGKTIPAAALDQIESLALDMGVVAELPADLSNHVGSSEPEVGDQP